MARYIDAEAFKRKLLDEKGFFPAIVSRALVEMPTADVVGKDKIAEMLRLMFNDDCACNYNGNDEWLPMKCKYAETDCPTPKERLGCWKEFVEYFLAKMDGGKTE